MLLPVYKKLDCIDMLADQTAGSMWATAWQNQQNGMCAQQRLGSAWASTQSDQSSLSAWSLARHWAHSEVSNQTGRMPRLIWAFVGRTCHFVGFVVRWLMSFRFYCAWPISYLYSRDILLYHNDRINTTRRFSGNTFMTSRLQFYTSNQLQTRQIHLWSKCP